MLAEARNSSAVLDYCANDRGDRLVMLAVLSRNTEVVRAVLRQGVTRNIASPICLRTPLHVACSMGLAEIVVVLLNGLEGEDYATTAEAVSVQDAYGCSALDLAATGGHVEVVRRIEEILAANEGGSQVGWQ